MENAPIGSLSIEKTINLGGKRRLAHVYHITNSISGLATIDYENNFLEWLPEGAPFFRDSYFPTPGEYLYWFRFDHLSPEPNRQQLLVQYANSGTAGVHPFYIYSYADQKFKLLLKLVEASNRTEIRDLDGDFNDEIVHEFSLSGLGKVERDLLRWKDIWRLNDDTPIKVNNLFPQEYKSLIDLYDVALTKKEWEPDVSFYYPVLRCLKEKASLVVSRRNAEVGDCRRARENLYRLGKNG